MAAKVSALGRAYCGTTVLVTGHTGFKGGWLSLWLKRLDARVIGFSLPSAHGEHGIYAAASVGRGMTSVVGDLRDPAAVERVFRRYRPSHVFHLAAQSLVLRSYRDPVATFATNVLGTAHVLESARACGSVRSVVVVTSDKCYENPEDGRPRREEDPMGGLDPYSASKGAAEIVATSYRHSYYDASRVGLACARAGNVIGGGDWSENRLLPDCARALGAGRPLFVRNPGSIRPWQHVLETSSAYLWLGACLAVAPTRFSGGWNFGPASARNLPVREIVELALKSWGRGTSAVRYGRRHGLHEAATLTLNAAKARRALGWRALYDAAEAVAETVSWYKAQHEGGDFDGEVFSNLQIDRYEAKARALGLVWASGGKL